MPNSYKYLIILFFIGAVTFFFAQPELKKRKLTSQLKNSYDIKYLETLAQYEKEVRTYIKVGMTKDEVRKILGEPHNTDNDNVWYWINSISKVKGEDKTWKGLLRQGNDGCYYLFEDDKVISSFHYTSSLEPDDYYRRIMKKDLP